MNWIVLSSTHVDSHGDVIAKSALVRMAQQINTSPLRQTIEHDPSIPPIGMLTEAKVVPLDDGSYALVAKQEPYLEIGISDLWDEEYVQLAVPGNQRPLNDRWADLGAGLSVSVDPVAVGDADSLRAWGKSLDDYGSIEKTSHFRKSSIPDPEIILNLGRQILDLSPEIIFSYLSVKFGKAIADPVLDKIGEDIADVILEAYSLFKEAPAEFVRKVVPIGRIATSIAVLQGSPHVVLIVKSSDPEKFEAAASVDHFVDCISRAKHLKKFYDATEVVFEMNDEHIWKLNYFVCADGRVYGSRPSLEVRRQIARQVLSSEPSPNSEEQD